MLNDTLGAIRALADGMLSPSVILHSERLRVVIDAAKVRLLMRKLGTSVHELSEPRRGYLYIQLIGWALMLLMLTITKLNMWLRKSLVK